MQKKILRTGNSDAILLDRVIKEISGIKSGEIVDIKCSKGKIVISKVNKEN